jgi:hypothetical protein
MSRHLASCPASHDPAGARTDLVLLRIEAAGDPRYWMYLEARRSATLQQLDAFLRRVWLECCGHMSAFWVGQQEVTKRSVLGLAFGERGLRFTYDYDFGSTTSLAGQVLGSRLGSLGRPALRLLARNDPLPCAIRSARAYAEGRPVRVIVKRMADVKGVEELLAVKLNPDTHAR